jgi:isocitrate dehydrogenase
MVVLQISLAKVRISKSQFIEPNRTGCCSLHMKLTVDEGIANPVATILSASMMLRYSFGLVKEAAAIEKAVEKVLDSKDIGGLEIRTK